jgi:hypothetical protein
VPLTAGKKRFGGWLIYLLSLELGHGSFCQIHERRLVSQSLKNCCSGVMLFTTLVIPTRRVSALLMKPSSTSNSRKPVRRVLINDYNATKIKESLANIRDNTEPQFTGWRRWGLARSRYDWLLGMNGTRAMTLRGREVGQQVCYPLGAYKRLCSI